MHHKLRTLLFSLVVVVSQTRIEASDCFSPQFPPQSYRNTWVDASPDANDFGIHTGGSGLSPSQHADPRSGILRHIAVEALYALAYARDRTIVVDELRIPISVNATGNYKVKIRLNANASLVLFSGGIANVDVATVSTKFNLRIAGTTAPSREGYLIYYQDSPVDHISSALLTILSELVDDVVSQQLQVFDLLDFFEQLSFIPVRTFPSTDLVYEIPVQGLVAGSTYELVAQLESDIIAEAAGLFAGEGVKASAELAISEICLVPDANPPVSCNDFQLVGADWSDQSSSQGDSDGVMEAGESPRVRIQLRNAGNQTLSQVSAVIATAPNDYNVFNSDAYFDSISPGQYRWSNDTFGMDLNFTLPNCNPRIDTLTIRVSYNRGSQPCYQDFQPSRIIYKDGCFQAAFNVPSFAIIDSPSIRSINNGNGILESGEKVHVKPRLCNGGSALATDLVARISSDSPCVEPISPSDWEHYPDLPVGICGELASNDYFVVETLKACCGPAAFKLHTTTDQIPAEQTISNAFTINIGCAPWISVTESYGFGAVVPGTVVTFNAEVRNIGSADLHVSNIIGLQCDGSPTSDITVNAPTSFTVAPGAARSITINLNTTGLNGQICRHVVVQSDGRIAHPGQDDRLVLSGLVANVVAVQDIPNVTSPDACDISGSLIVWDDYRASNGDIVGYDVLTGQQFPICSHPANQGRPFVSGQLVAWEDDRNGQNDIYARDLQANVEFPISTDSAHERLIGVDGNLIAVARRYITLTEPSERSSLYNVIVYEYLGSSQVTVRYASSFSANTQHQPMASYTAGGDESDFGGRLLVLSRFEVWWDSTFWNGRADKTQVIDFLAGETSPIDAVGRELDHVAAAEHRFAYQYNWAPNSRDYLIQMWRSTGAVENVVPVFSDNCNPGDDVVAVGGPDGSDIVVYNYDCSQLGADLYYRDRAASTEGLLSTGDGDPRTLRMDGYGVAWVTSSRSEIKYAYFKQPEIAVAWGNPPFSNSNPIEGQSFSATVIASNLSTQYAATGNITVRLFLGDPDSGGVQVGADQFIGGGLAPGASQPITFSNVPAQPVVSGDEQSFQYFVKVWSNAIDNPDNNKASCTLLVRDNDTQSPQFVAFGVVEHLGNGDGVISNTEQVRIYWSINDASGVNSVQVRVDNGAPAISQDANGFLIIGSLAIGSHEISITAEDADPTPASANRNVTFQVDACPNDPEKLAPGLCGCGAIESNTDTDADGILDCVDACPQDTDNDIDQDGVCGNLDLCPTDFDPTNADTDGDGKGDTCDNCPNIANATQTNTDSDGLGDACDTCPTLTNSDQMDTDSDGIGDACDNCPVIANADQGNSDGDGAGDACDGCPSDSEKVSPGICNCGIRDSDSDGDGSADCIDECPDDSQKTTPGICGCGVPDSSVDSDGDGIPDCRETGGPSGNPGACCVTGAPCELTSENECLQRGGIWAGEGTLCSTATCGCSFSLCGICLIPGFVVCIVGIFEMKRRHRRYRD